MSPGPITSLLPIESACSISPWNATVIVSKPRCGFDLFKEKSERTKKIRRGKEKREC